jgi:hypothetical protein
MADVLNDLKYYASLSPELCSASRFGRVHGSPDDAPRELAPPLTAVLNRAATEIEELRAIINEQASTHSGALAGR